MKRLMLFIFSLLFVANFSSCEESGRKCMDPKKCPDHQKERHERRW